MRAAGKEEPQPLALLQYQSLDTSRTRARLEREKAIQARSERERESLSESLSLEFSCFSSSAARQTQQSQTKFVRNQQLRLNKRSRSERLPPPPAAVSQSFPQVQVLSPTTAATAHREKISHSRRMFGRRRTLSAAFYENLHGAQFKGKDDDDVQRIEKRQDKTQHRRMTLVEATTREDVMDSNLKSQPSVAGESRAETPLASDGRMGLAASEMHMAEPSKGQHVVRCHNRTSGSRKPAVTRHKWPHAQANTESHAPKQLLAPHRASCNKLSLSIIYQQKLLVGVALLAVALASRLAVCQLSTVPLPATPDQLSGAALISSDELAIEAEDASFYESSRRGATLDDTTPAASTQTIRLARQSTSQPNSQTTPTLVDEALQEDSLVSQQQAYDYHANMPVITKRELGNAIKQAATIVDKLHSQAPPQAASSPLDELIDNDIQLEVGWLASSMFHKPAPDDAFVLNQTRLALIGEEATKILAKQYKLNRHQTLRGLPLISVDQTTLGKQCPRPVRTFSCIPGRYRSLSGHCNNVQQPDWGSAQTPLVRYAPARYSDNISRPPRASSTRLDPSSQPEQPNLLPSARQVSTAVYEAALQQAASDSGQGLTPSSLTVSALLQHSHSHMTTMLSFFGQFVFHDLAFVPQFSKSIKCCRTTNSNQQATGKPQHPECMPIELRSTGGANFCLDYVRSVPATRNGCNLGPRDQLNLVSSFLDGSVIYGSSEAQMSQLRTFSGGRLRSQRLGGAQAATGGPQQLELLPQIKWTMTGANETDPHWWSEARECLQMATMRRRRQPQSLAGSSRFEDSPASMMEQMNLNCFQAGDTRVNENIGLTLMHTIWLREHNLVADKLAQLNRHWHDQRLFEESRRIVVAELQQIAYNELLPSILGDEVMQRFNLTIQSQGYSQTYDPALNPGVSNELASAVFPFILATIPSALERYSARLEMLGSTSLADTFMDGSDLFKRNKFAQYLTGMMSQNAMEPALGLVPMTMRASSGGDSRTRNTSGSSQQDNAGSVAALASQLDAVALTIQQGRDHGLRPYLYWRRVCQLRPTVRSWADLEQVMPRATVERLQQVYANVDQLDLYMALLENPAPGATLGPTFVCLLARQFYQLKHGDRYWFENDLPGIAFTPKQLDEIRQTSLAKVMCRNSQASISFIQPSPMLASDPFLNAYQYCTNKAMDDLDLNHWRQPVNSAQQVADEQLADELVTSRHHEFGNSRALQRGKRMVQENIQLIAERLGQASGRLDELARQESAQIRSAMAAKARARRSTGSNGEPQQGRHGVHGARGYRYLPRPKRQALSINNQSVILELATNEVVRSLLRQGKDRERPQSIQNDIRDFLYSLESIQLDNLLDNSAASDSVEQFIASANSFFLTEEQRLRLAASGDATLSSDPLNELLTSTTSSRSNSISMNCQDDDRAFPCDHTTPFRTITGWCNNLQQPKFGQSFTLHDRILPSAYQDGLSKPRQLSVSGTSEQPVRLPSARLISTTVHDDRSQLHVRYSLALMQFGQFGVDHDLTRTPFSVALDGSLLDCSSCDSQRTVHRDCLPIEVPDNDAFYQSARARTVGGPAKKCLHFVRSLNGQRALGPRQQLNALTAYLDASQVYGSDNCEAKSLRAFSGGRLNASSYPAGTNLNYVPREILPITRLNPECVTPNGLCFHAGDQRASEQPGLTAIHTIFMRFHNSIVDQLAAINRHWNDEKLYQHGRRIVGAILQRITYNEFAPRLLGLDYMSKFDLMLKQVGYSDNYDESCSASILTEFASAAFRMGHSLIRGSFPLLNRQYKQAGKALQLRTAFFNSDRILSEPQLIDQIMRGIVTTPIETLDSSITEELTNHLFERPREPFSGMDLISLNIQRARDHGIPGYNRYRQKCNLTRARTFDELAGEIPQRLIKRLSSLYASVDDIDLFTGGLSEMPVHGGIIGPTFGCIIGMQLGRLKRCDRFWHETSDPFVRFSAAQLAEIRKITLAKVICSQSDLIDTIQRQAMDVPDNYLNPRLPCASLPSLDLGAWRENQKSCLVNKIKIELGQSKRVNPCKSCTCTLEGPVCRTAKINCLKMMQKGPRQGAAFNQIMADKSCLVQCAWALDMQPQ